MQDHRAREVMEKPCSYLFEGENDNIYSVCNYVSELIYATNAPQHFIRIFLIWRYNINWFPFRSCHIKFYLVDILLFHCVSM
jgi:hypothetical protein